MRVANCSNLTTLLQEDTLNSIKIYMETKPNEEWKNTINPKCVHSQKLLSSLQNHILAHLVSKNKQNINTFEILNTHLEQLFPLIIQVLNKSADILEQYPPSLELLYNVLLDSVSGSMFLKLLSSLLLMPVNFVRKLLPELLNILIPLDKFNKLLPVEIMNDLSSVSSRKSL